MVRERTSIAGIMIPLEPVGGSTDRSKQAGRSTPARSRLRRPMNPATVVAEIAETVDDEDLRESFLSLPRVRAVLATA